TSDQCDIQAIDRLEIAFEDGPIAAPVARPARARGKAASPAAPETASAPPPAVPLRGLASPGARKDAAASAPTPPLAVSPDAASPADLAAGDPPADAKPAHPQGHLVARVVRARALRDGDRTELTELWAEQNVEMTQPPDTPDGRDKVVRGDTLHVKRL